jgi:hypothetical protein
MARTRSANQLGLFDDPAPAAKPGDYYLALNYRQSLIEQVRRDTEAIEEDPDYADFYRGRIELYRAEVRRIGDHDGYKAPPA